MHIVQIACEPHQEARDDSGGGEVDSAEGVDRRSAGGWQTDGTAEGAGVVGYWLEVGGKGRWR